MQITDVKSKLAAQKDAKEQELALAKRMDELMGSEEPPRGCGGGCIPWRRRASKVASGEARVQSATDARFFGQRSKQVDAAAKLQHAADSVSTHVEQLSQKGEAARRRAMELKAAGKRTEALAALKKAKTFEKQLETASATQVALEQQIDVLSQSALQKEVATALSASVATTKKKTKGLLSKTEDAVDGAVELKDFAEDIAQTLTGIQTETYDDDELLAELDEMVEPTAVPAQPAATVAEPAAIVVGVDPHAYPAAPTKRVEREALLAES